MSIKSIIAITLAVLASAFVCLAVVSIDSEATSFDNDFMTVSAELLPDNFEAMPFGPQSNPMETSGLIPIGGDPDPMTGPRAPADQPEKTILREIPVDFDPMHVEIMVPDHAEPVASKIVIDDYEQIYKEKRELESNGADVEIIDGNEYEGVQAELVSVMMMLMIEETAIAEGDFLPYLLNELEQRELSDAADLVRYFIDYGTVTHGIMKEIDPNGFKSKDGDEVDDISSEPCYIEEVEDEEDAPVLPDAFLIEEGYDTSFMTADDFDVRFVDRGCKVAF